MFRFVSSGETLTAELNANITAASAWVHITSTGATKPSENENKSKIYFALVLQSFTELNNNITKLEQALKAETKARTEADLVLANYIARTNNLLREKSILEHDVERIDHAHSLLYNCQVCFDTAVITLRTYGYMLGMYRYNNAFEW